MDGSTKPLVQALCRQMDSSVAVLASVTTGVAEGHASEYGMSINVRVVHFRD